MPSRVSAELEQFFREQPLRGLFCYRGCQLCFLHGEHESLDDRVVIWAGCDHWRCCVYLTAHLIFTVRDPATLLRIVAQEIEQRLQHPDPARERQARSSYRRSYVRRLREADSFVRYDPRNPTFVPLTIDEARFLYGVQQHAEDLEFRPPAIPHPLQEDVSRTAPPPLPKKKEAPKPPEPWARFKRLEQAPEAEQKEDTPQKQLERFKRLEVK